MKNLIQEFSKGILRENPTFKLALGLCPTLAVSTSVMNGFGMGVAATFVLVGSSTIVALIKKFIPDKIRIPCFIVVIASFVTIVELVMKAYFPELSKSLGIFVPLIVVNCVVLGRAEAFASRHTLGQSVFDALGMGAGFALSLVIISAIREAFGNGTLFGLVIAGNFEPALLFILAPGAMLVIGLLMGMFNYLMARK